MKKNKYSFKQKLAAKSLYITAIAAFAVIIASVIITYYTTDRYDLLETSTSDYLYTQQAQAEKNDVPDERSYIFTDEEEENSSKEETTTVPETSYRPVSTTQTTTEEKSTEAQIVNSSFVLPLSGEITAEFSLTRQQYNQTMQDWRIHAGTDFAAEEGENIYAVGNGKVTKVLSDSKWGYIIEIDHGSFTARYCGLNQENAISIGKEVRSGDVIGQVGTIPIEAEDGAHLHFEAVQNGSNVDPAEVLNISDNS